VLIIDITITHPIKPLLILIMYYSMRTSLRSRQGITFFPRVFFLLFALCHFYLFSFPMGFSYAALASTIGFMFHSMVFFWNRFELVAVAQGSAPPPRMHHGSSDATLALPSISLSPRHPLLFRQHSQASSFAPSSSRHASSVTLHPPLGGEDGDDSSFVLYLEGEVVRPAIPEHVVAHATTPSDESQEEEEEMEDLDTNEQVSFLQESGHAVGAHDNSTNGESE
jgi:hypothetical protein